MAENEFDQSVVTDIQDLTELLEVVLLGRSPAEMAESALRVFSRMLGGSGAVLYGKDDRLVSPFFSHTGISGQAVPAIQEWCTAQIGKAQAAVEMEGRKVTFNGHGEESLYIFPLVVLGKAKGFLGLALPGDAAEMVPIKPYLRRLISHLLVDLLGRTVTERRLHYLNTYLNVSSTIAQVLGLRDVLEAVLYLSMEAVTAEAASVLLLDAEKKNFRFYSVEGTAKPVLQHTTFPADRGLAGAALQSLSSEVINDVQNDPRFYGKIDATTGFVTRSMVLIPLVAGEEKVGVLELLNKTDATGFTEEDRNLLQSIAEEVAFAIRDATLFEWVVNAYCKQLQGQNSCKGCKRPLGSWTPCVKYREREGLLE